VSETAGISDACFYSRFDLNKQKETTRVFMKKSLLYLLTLMLPALGFSQAFTPGDLVVTRVGLGDQALSNKSVPVTLTEVNPLLKTVVQTITVPYHSSQLTGNNNKLVTQGSSSNDANITTSANGAYFVITGYTTDTGVVNPSAVSPRVQRTIGRIAMDGTVNTSTLIDTLRSSGNARCATSNDGTSFWQVGSAIGVRYVPFGSTGIFPDTAATVSTTVTNFRTIQTYGGDLIIGSASGAIARIGKLSGFPTTTGNVITALPGTSVATSANSIFMTSLPGGPAGLNTMYVADDGSQPGIKKYSLNAGTNNWDSLGIIDAGGTYRGLTGIATGSTVTLYAIKGGSPLFRFVDVNGYGAGPGTFTSPFDTVLKAATNTAFRGVQIVPTGVLPIQLLSFNASKTEDGKSKVWWVITGEEDVMTYVVQKSDNGKDFIAIGAVKPNGNSQYTFNDDAFLTSTKYYRVQFVSKSGKVSYSNVVAVTAKKSVSLDVFPNPAESNIVVSYPKTSVTSSILITNAEGKSVMAVPVSNGSTSTTVNVSALPKGSYFVTFADAESNRTTKQIIKK
jgi:hypothetical protein